MKMWTVLSLLLIMGLSAGAAQITLVADTWCPYNCEPNSELPGFMVEAATMILGAAGHEVKYLLSDDWEQAVADVEAGKFNGCIGADPTDNQNLLFPDEDMGVSQNRIYVRKGDPWRYTGPASLEGTKVVVLTGYTYGDDVDAWLSANALYVDTLEQAVEALLGEKADILFENEYVMSMFTMMNNIPDSLEVAGMMESGPVYIAFSNVIPESKEYADLLSKGLKTMKADGSWKALLSKYGLEE